MIVGRDGGSKDLKMGVEVWQESPGLVYESEFAGNLAG